MAAHYETSGKLMMPLITLHTTGDPIIPIWHEWAYSLKTLFAGTLPDRSDLPVAAYGHCNFSSTDIFLGFAILGLKDIGQDITSSIAHALPDPDRSAFMSRAQNVGLRP